MVRRRLMGDLGPMRPLAGAFPPPPGSAAPAHAGKNEPSASFSPEHLLAARERLAATHAALTKARIAAVEGRLAAHDAAAGAQGQQDQQGDQAVKEGGGEGDDTRDAAQLELDLGAQADLLSPAQRARIVANIRTQRQRREAYEARERSAGLRKLLGNVPWLSVAEANVVFERCVYDADRAEESLRDAETVLTVRKEVALLSGGILDASDEGVARTVVEGRGGSSSSSSSSGWLTRRSKRGPNAPPIDRKLRLDDALKQADTMEGWSEARKRVYAKREENPNAYYYRFNDPGEPQKNGRWTDGEEKQFFERMKSVGVDGKWGIFSMAIPGRVGYQCSNFYRLLLEQGRIADDRYVFDDQGKAHMRRGDGTVRGAAGRSGAALNANPTSAANANANTANTAAAPLVAAGLALKKRAASASASASAPPPKKMQKRANAKKSKARKAVQEKEAEKEAAEKEKEAALDRALAAQNPLPGVTDAITQIEVRRPAMSPDGHVLGYQTWLRVLAQEPTNTCPFTKQRLTRRQLVLLTHDNIAEHRGRLRLSHNNQA
jgi:hypothetical protein